MNQENNYYAIKKQVYQANYKARRRGAGEAFTVAQWLELCDLQNWLCAICGERKKLVIDHVVPVRRGGLNRIDNVQGLCGSCCATKNAKG